MSGLSFRGIRKSYLTVLRGRKRPAWAPLQRHILTVPGCPGGYLQDTQTQVRQITVPVYIEGADMTDLQKLKEDLAAWLVTSKEEELIFDDEPDRVYFAVVDGSFDPEELVRYGQGLITFICLDPYKYGNEQNRNFTNSGVITVAGSADSFPTFKCLIKADTTYVAVSDGQKINLIGNPTKQEETPYAPESNVLNFPCNTLTGWTTSSSTSIEGPTQLGTLKTNGDFYTDDYGTLVGPWHGPAMKRSLGQTIQDFRFDVGVSMQKTGANQAGGIEVDLLDASSKIIAKVTLTKHHGGLDNLYSRVRAGTFASGHDIIDENQAIFNSSVSGIFRVSRKGNLWTAQIFYAENGVFKSKIQSIWKDENSIATAAVTQVQARLFQRGDFPVVTQTIADINVYKLNDPAAGQVPILVKNGDTIIFDHKSEIILKNGEPFIKEKAFIGEYFPLSPGANSIVAEPAEAIRSVEVKWRDRWL